VGEGQNLTFSYRDCSALGEGMWSAECQLSLITTTKTENVTVGWCQSLDWYDNYAPAPNRRGIKRCFYVTSDVCLSVAYIGPKSRTEAYRKTKIGTEVAHVTRDSDTTFRVKRSNVKVTRPLCSGGCSGGHENVLAVGNCCYVDVCSAAEGASAPTGRKGAGAYRGGRPHTACWMRQYKRQLIERTGPCTDT